MPVTPTYPGVYIEEIPSGVRTITGVATSITAFVGRALRGPVNEPVTLNSYGDFERIFGGLWAGSTLGFAVRDFYQNGGSQAIVVRLFSFDQKALAAAQAVGAATTGKTGQQAKTDAAAEAKKINDATTASATEKSAAKAVSDAVAGLADDAAVGIVAKAVNEAIAAFKVVSQLVVGGTSSLTLVAASEGAWGNNLRARIDHNVVNDPGKVLFNLYVQDGGTGQVEEFRNVSIQPDHPRRVDSVLKNDSRLVRVSGNLPTSRPEQSDPETLSDEIGRKDLFDPARSSGVLGAGKAIDGRLLEPNDFTGTGMETNKTGLYALEKADLFNLLCIPPHQLTSATGKLDTDSTLLSAAATYCEKRRAMLIIDAPSAWKDKDAAKAPANSLSTRSKNAAVFFPRLKQFNPLKENRMEEFAACGAIAGIFARTDAQRGVWKAPAGLDAALNGVPALSVNLTDLENGELNPLGINCLRSFPAAGRVVWGSRTLQGNDRLASEWKYIPVRRLTLFLEESLYRGTQWVVFEPNDEPLWSQIRLNLGAFMNNLFRQGAFQGKTPKDAYFVKCDSETTTQNDINLGIVNIVVGFAPLKPAEFVIIKFQQMAGQIAA